jgi:hypothetical protein
MELLDSGLCRGCFVALTDKRDSLMSDTVIKIT